MISTGQENEELSEGCNDSHDRSPQADQKKNPGRGRDKQQGYRLTVGRSNEGNDAVLNRDGTGKEPQDEEPFARPAVWKHRKQALQRRTFPE